MKLDLKEWIYKMTHLVEVKTLSKASDGNGLVALSSSDFDITKPFLIVKNTGGYASIPYYSGNVAYFRLTTFSGGNLTNTPTTVYVVVLNVWGVLLNSILKAFSHLRIGGGVDEGNSQGIVRENTCFANIKNTSDRNRKFIGNNVYAEREHKRLQNVDCNGIVELFQSMDNRNRYKGIYNEYPSTLPVIRNRICSLQSFLCLCITKPSQSSRQRFFYEWNDNNRYSLTHSERGCAV